MRKSAMGQRPYKFANVSCQFVFAIFNIVTQIFVNWQANAPTEPLPQKLSEAGFGALAHPGCVFFRRGREKSRPTQIFSSKFRQIIL
jgi:hypothetical protein